MEYLADTVTIIRHFSKTGKIGKRAKSILDDVKQGNSKIYISIISLVEILYLSEKKRIPIDLDKVKYEINNLDNYQLIDLNIDIVEKAKLLKGLELHDRLIVATGLFFEIPIITSDKEIEESKIIETIWN